MSDEFLTNPENPRKLSRPQVKNKRNFFTYKERVEVALVASGISFNAARTSVIDMKGSLIVSFQEKRSPDQAADNIIDDVRRIYKT